MKNNPQDIMNGMQQKNLLLQSKNDELAKLSEKKAEAERHYNVLYAMEMLKLRGEGMSVTMIDKLTRGNESVADARLKADIAEGVYKACLESIKDIRTAIDTYRSLLAWIKEEMKGANIG